MAIARRCSCGGTADLSYPGMIGKCSGCGKWWNKYKEIPEEMVNQLIETSRRQSQEKMLQEIKNKERDKFQRAIRDNYRKAPVGFGTAVQDRSPEMRVLIEGTSKEEQKLRAMLDRILIEFPALGSFDNFYDFVQKIWPSRISQRCVVRNLSFMGSNGLVRKAELYNTSSSFSHKCLPANTYIAFDGRLSNGQFVIETIRVVANPVMKRDDIVTDFIFMYDGPKKYNALFNFINEPAGHDDKLQGELLEWNRYLDWKRHLAELKIQGIKYIGIKFNIAEREMSFLAVCEGDEAFNKIKSALKRNEVSAFSNMYSNNQWLFVFNPDESAYKNDSGIELIYLGEGAHYQRDEIDDSWDVVRSNFRKYDNQLQDHANIQELLGAISRNYFEPRYVELRFEISSSATELIERSLRRGGGLPDNIENRLAEEFFGDGYLATSQIGDFALIHRLKHAISELSLGKAASQGLDGWLFDISKARLPEGEFEITNWLNNKMNDKQKQAVSKIFAAPDIFLIQGPPGTGKTTVIAETIFQAAIRNQRVLVSSQANLAVDNALERLISNPAIRAIRLGKTKKINTASSINSITEDNVLESFYNSIVRYLQEQYLDKWQRGDSVVEECDNDYEKFVQIENCQKELDDEINSETVRLNLAIESLKSSDSNLLEDNLKIEKTSLSFITPFILREVDEIELVLSPSQISMFWNAIEDTVIRLQNYGIWITKVGIRRNDLFNEEGVIDANSILQNIFVNLRRLIELRDKFAEEKMFGGNNAELEALIIREEQLKNKLLFDMSEDIITEWRSVNNRMKELREASGELSEQEYRLFSKSDSCLDSYTNIDKIKEIIEDGSRVIEKLKQEIIAQCEEILKNIDSSLQAIQQERDIALKEIAKSEEKIRDLEEKKQQEQSRENKILAKYDASRDEFEEKLFRCKTNAMRTGSVERSDWEGIFEGFTEWVKSIPDYEQEKDLFLKSFINGCNVVGVSCTENARTLDEAGFDDFDIVIIDEVSKATPPELLIPMLRGRKIVLVGDHRQLPPLFNEHDRSYQEVAEQQSSEEDGKMLTMEDFVKYKDMVTSSLFQRFFENADGTIKETLKYQYRMHTDIMNIINFFYDGCLKDGNEERYLYDEECKQHHLRIHSTGGTSMIVPEKHAYWIDSSTLDRTRIFEQRMDGSNSLFNLLEAYTIVELLRKMEIEYANQHRKTGPISVGVISFYYDQVKVIKDMIKKDSFYSIDVEVNTVDRFQGKEKEIILVSLVRNKNNNFRNTDSHIAAFQRINVAFSRAQNLLIIVGAKDMYAPQPVIISDMNTGEEKTVYVYKDIIEMLDRNGTFYSCDEVLSERLVDEVFEKISAKGGF